MIAIIDYGRGNIGSVYKAFLYLGFNVKIVSDPSLLKNASRVILPGVGAFGDGMNQLNKLGFAQVIPDIISKGVPFLGICLGMQLLFESSEESPGAEGLSIFKGKVPRFTGDYKIPHMGWNNVRFNGHPGLTEGVPEDSFFYFVHSYKTEPEDKTILFGETDYHGKFVSAVCKNNVLAFQFHPEKSQACGIRLLKNWGDSC